MGKGREEERELIWHLLMKKLLTEKNAGFSKPKTLSQESTAQLQYDRWLVKARAVLLAPEGRQKGVKGMSWTFKSISRK